MTIKAEIIADSISEAGVRLTTMQLRYPRFIHAEFMTHRVFSRNASSSRAIPVAKLIEDIRRDPAMPVHWGKNQPGMQAREEHDAPVQVPDHFAEALVPMPSRNAWLEAMERAIEMAEAFNAAGYHKQIVNRLLEPFSHINVVVTATNWDNFYELRRHPDAQPEIKALADAMWEAQQASTPVLLKQGEWHLPYITNEDWASVGERTGDIEVSDMIKVSVARCARVSYLTHDGRKTHISEDMDLYDRLVGSVPLHASPAEHQATPDVMMVSQWQNPWLHGNMHGWQQYRKMIE